MIISRTFCTVLPVNSDTLFQFGNKRLTHYFNLEKIEMFLNTCRAHIGEFTVLTTQHFQNPMALATFVRCVCNCQKNAPLGIESFQCNHSITFVLASFSGTRRGNLVQDNVKIASFYFTPWAGTTKAEKCENRRLL